MKDIVIPIELCHENAVMPKYAHYTDGAMDIYAIEDKTFNPNETTVIKTGLKVAIPNGYALLIQPRSGMSVNTPLRVANTPGLIDSGYRDEIGVIMWNSSDEEYSINKGDRIAQIRLVEVPHIKWERISDVRSIIGDRGGGFGSTGK